MKVVIREAAVYQSDLTGHWIVDEFGTKENPGSRRQAWRSKEDADADAATKAYVIEVPDEQPESR